ncbi:MAG: Holliday junction branch migration protein RuvA, partial [Anaerolineae bacterium]
MIATLNGKVLQCGEQELVVAVGGVGLRVHVPASLAQESRTGEEIFLHTHLVVREDSLTLYGFAHAAECALFQTLLGINGVGPRLA